MPGCATQKPRQVLLGLYLKQQSFKLRLVSVELFVNIVCFFQQSDDIADHFLAILFVFCNIVINVNVFLAC